MAWPTLDNVEALQRNARHNARFSIVRLPLIFIVGGLLWQLLTPAVALAWSATMLVVERAAVHVRGRLIRGDLRCAYLHLLTLAVMSALWVWLGLLLWGAGTEVGRIAAVIALLTTAVYGSITGQKDLRPAAILTIPPLSTLFALLSGYAWTHWPMFDAAVASLATLGTCLSVSVCAWALNRSDATLQQTNLELAQLAAKLADNTTLLEETSAIASLGGWRLDLITCELTWTAETRCIHGVDDAFVPTVRNALDFYDADSAPILENAFLKAQKTGEPWDLELKLRSAKGVDKWVRVSGRATLVDGVPVNLHGAFADISERVALEEGLRQAQKLESVGRLAGGVAHDFNNVLTAIVNSARILESAADTDERYAQPVTTILKAAERATSLTRSLLAFSRQQVLAPQPTDINEAITEAASLLTALIPADIQVIAERHKGDVFALLDPGQLSSALVNLAVNAKEAMPTGGVLRLSASIRNEPDAAYAVITVKDSGRGIDPAIASRVFDPFFTTKGESGGTGLGLAMVHGFVSQSGGDITLDSTPGVGTTFTLRFPLILGGRPAAARAQAEAAPSRPLAGARILLVDDDDLVRDALELSLHDAGYSVVSAADGPQALQLFDDGKKFDVAIADVVLTAAMSGPQLSQKLCERNAALKTVLVSGYARDKLTESGRLPAGVTFLQKPFSIETLNAHMAELHIAPPQGDFGF